ncbi:MAG: 30S ribosomal protein S15 [Candidatus Poseidoniaceae archaeon]|nr:30S ribosomal protein S15 [Candidatus Poseidoniaceae archaeon]MDP7000369.1 30S ribosomal protein S15 [Candidatus Poseidoniaceae archaeon]
MARMYAHRRGKSGSTKPHNEDLPEWSNTDKEEVEALVLTLNEKGHSSAMIGTILRDQHAVPNPRAVLGRRISQVIAEKGKQGAFPEDMMNLMRKAVGIIDHLKTNRKDLHNSRSLNLIESKIRRLANYYQAKGSLDSEWKYKRDQVHLVVE